MRFITYAIIFGFLLSCGSEEITPRSYPRVRTSSVTEITTTGALLNGAITYSSVPIDDYGFVVSEWPNSAESNSEVVSLGARSGPIKFKYRIERALKENIPYYVKAYARSGEKRVYGETITFLSLGGLSPVVESVAPISGTWRDTLTIHGKNFSSILANTEVNLGKYMARVVEQGPDKIRCIVPDSLDQSPAAVHVRILENIATLDDAFSLNAPVIESISPSSAYFGDEITVIGKNFSSYATQVTVEGTAVTETTTKTKIVFKLPQVSGEVATITVSNGQNSNAFGSVNLLLPKISSICPLSGFTGENVVIKGENFRPGTFKIFFGTKEASIVTATASEIKVIVPELIGPSHVISYQAGTVKASFAQPFQFSPPIVTGFELHSGSSLVITGQNFSSNTYIKFGNQPEIPADGNSENVYVQVPLNFNVHEVPVKLLSGGHTVDVGTIYLPWIKLSTQRLIQRVYTFGNKIYAETGDDFPAKVLEFDPDTRAWIQHSERPSSSGILFTVSGTLFCGGFEILEDGVYKDPNGALVHSFDPTTKTWQRKNDASFWFNQSMKGFEIAGKTSIVRPADPLMEVPGNTWTYDNANDQWIDDDEFELRSDLEIALPHNNDLYAKASAYLLKLAGSINWSTVSMDFYYQPMFVLGDKIYVHGSNEVFDLSSLQWAESNYSYPGDGDQSFSTSTHGYAVGWDGSLWEFKPEE